MHTVHTTTVLAAGATKKEASVNSGRQIARILHTRTLNTHTLTPGYNKNAVHYDVNSAEVFKVEVVTQKKKNAPLTEAQITVIIGLFKGDQLWFDPERNEWWCRNKYVHPRTIKSLYQKGVVKCAAITKGEQAIQVALGTMHQDAIQLVFIPTAAVIKRNKKFSQLLQSWQKDNT